MVLSKIPRWILIGVGILAFISGMVNVMAVLGFAHYAATHMTGLFSFFSIALARGEWAILFQTVGILVSFFMGAVVTGGILRDAHLKMGAHYELVMVLEGVLLLVATYGFYSQRMWGEYAAAMAAGLQNAMVSTYSGTIIRTTHLTGVLTDLGVLIGHRLRGGPADQFKTKLFFTLIATFVSGGFLGAYFYLAWGALAMLVPAILVFVCALSYRVLSRNERR